MPEFCARCGKERTGQQFYCLDCLEEIRLKREHILSDIEDFIEANKFKEKEDSAYWSVDADDLIGYLYKIRQKIQDVEDKKDRRPRDESVDQIVERLGV